MGQHIVSSFDDDLMQVQAKISEMGGHAEEMLSNVLESLQKRDAGAANEVLKREKRLDALEAELDELTTRIIALRQPMAQDLRVLIAAAKIASTLERIGDLSENIARRSIYLAESRPAKLTTSLVMMGERTLEQLTSVLDAYISRDTALALAVWNSDIEIDDMYNAIFRELLTYMMEDTRKIGLGSQLLFVAKNLERIADHTTHIAEMVYYIVEGKALEGERPKGDPIGMGEL